MMPLQRALQWLPGARLVGDGTRRVQRVHTDTRTLQAGDLFVALRGERFDAHDFLIDAHARGATAVLAHRGRIPPGCTGIEVDDTRLALGQLAAGWRAQFTLPLIAVTGSNGKTTVTQMIASILRAWRGEAALATQGNLNNDIGVPLTLLRLRADHAVAVVEMGMNHVGEIARLAAIARPTVALVNNAQREHLEFMGTVEAVARENGAVIESLGPDGCAVFPADDAYTPLWTRLCGARPRLLFTDAQEGRAAQVRGSGVWREGCWAVEAHTPAGALAFRLAIAGRHNVRNALAAMACAMAAGAPVEAVQAGLEAFKPVKGRSRALSIRFQGRPITVVDDTYNANPDSVCAAIDVLADLPAPRLLVLGDMGEVGDQGPQLHAEVGRYAHRRGIDRLFTLGEQSRHASSQFPGGRHFVDVDRLLSALREALPDAASVLVKGSRFMRMERVVDAIIPSTPQQGEVSHAA